MTPEPEPGYFEYRATKGAPRQGVRIIHDGEMWHCLINGRAAPRSPARDPLDIPMLLYRWPMKSITKAQYSALLAEAAAAGPNHPLSRPDEPVDLKNGPPLR